MELSVSSLHNQREEHFASLMASHGGQFDRAFTQLS